MEISKLILELFKVKEAENNITILEFTKNINNVIVYDPGLHHVSLTKSSISRINPENGELTYRGQALEVLTVRDYLDVAYLLIYGKEIENTDRRDLFKRLVMQHFQLYEESAILYQNLPDSIEPMDQLALGLTSLPAFGAKYYRNEDNELEENAFLIAQTGILIIYMCQKATEGPSKIKFHENKSFAEQILLNIDQIAPNQVATLGSVLNKLLIIHAEHGQNASTATVRNVASTHSCKCAALSSGVNAFKGTLHGGASFFVAQMYDALIQQNADVDSFISEKIAAKQPIIGLGHRIYNKIPGCWDRRVVLMKQMLDDKSINFSTVLEHITIFEKIVERVVSDEYFSRRNISPNPDLLNSIFFKLLGFENKMNPAVIALSRMAGWIAHYREHKTNNYPITRPRDLYE